MPEAVAFATKPALGRRMLARAVAAGVPGARVTGDGVYGADAALRRRRRPVEASGRGDVPAGDRRPAPGRQAGKPVAAWLDDVPAGAWRRLSAGAKGPRLSDRAWLPDRAAAAPGWQKGLLIRRKIAKPDELTFDLTLAPAAAAPLAALVRVAGARRTSEACSDASGVGPRCIQGRGRPGPLTAPEVRRLVRRLVWARPPDPAPVLAWSTWRRRHQQRARRCHWRRRLRRREPRL